MLKFSQDPDTLDNPTNEGIKNAATKEPKAERPRHPHYISWVETYAEAD